MQGITRYTYLVLRYSLLPYVTVVSRWRSS